MLDYVSIPTTITLSGLNNEKSISPSSYGEIYIKNRNIIPLKKLIKLPLIDGKEVGSKEYIKKSNKYFIRTKALQSGSYLLEVSSESVLPIRPQSFKPMDLREGYVLISKDSKVGEVAYLEKDYPNHMISGGLKALIIPEDRFYILAFLKSSFFKTQLSFKIPKGATIKHGKTKFLDCFIPFPNQVDGDDVIRYISELTKSIIRKEIMIKEKNKIIDEVIGKELLKNQKSDEYVYHNPIYNEMGSLNRIDAGFYSEEFKRHFFVISNYKHGAMNIEGHGYKLSRGQNLQVSTIGRSIYSDEPKENFYKVYLPKYFTKYGTISKILYLGNKNILKCLEKGDIVFGAEGFEKGRSIVITDEISRTITNIHGIIFKSEEHNVIKSIFIRCFMNYMRNMGLIDKFAVGGNGGSLAQKYWGTILFPNFSETKQKEIARYYHNPIKYDVCDLSLDNFERKDTEVTEESGILELDKQIKAIKQRLDEVIHQIVMDEEVEIDFSFLGL
jgi:type I restriction enzyme S subunit